MCTLAHLRRRTAQAHELPGAATSTAEGSDYFVTPNIPCRHHGTIALNSVLSVSRRNTARPLSPSRSRARRACGLVRCDVCRGTWRSTRRNDTARPSRISSGPTYVGGGCSAISSCCSPWSPPDPESWQWPCSGRRGCRPDQAAPAISSRWLGPGCVVACCWPRRAGPGVAAPERLRHRNGGGRRRLGVWPSVCGEVWCRQDPAWQAGRAGGGSCARWWVRSSWIVAGAGSGARARRGFALPVGLAAESGAVVAAAAGCGHLEADGGDPASVG